MNMGKPTVCSCLPRRFCSTRRRFLLVLLCSLVLILLSAFLHMSRSPGQSGWRCRTGNLWSCSLAGKAAPLVQPWGDPFVSSVPRNTVSWLSGVVDLWLADGLSNVLPSSIGLSPERSSARWTYETGADDLSISSSQCQIAFPGLYSEIGRARSRYERFHISQEDLDAIEISEGRVRAGILEGKLLIFKSNLKTEKSRTNALAILQSLHDAISNSPKVPVPNIEFVISVNSHVPDLTKPLWVPDRRGDDENVWVMPDSKFVMEEARLAPEAVASEEPRRETPRGWLQSPPKSDNGISTAERAKNESEIFAITRSQLVAEVERVESALSGEEKLARLVAVWRNDNVPDNARQKQLVRIADGRPWAETTGSASQRVIAGIDGDYGMTSESASSTFDGRRIHRRPLAEICRYLFLAHDGSFHIPLADGPLLCSSIILTTRPKWIQIYHPLILVNGDHYHMGDAEHPVVQEWSKEGSGLQNAVVVADDWSDLDVKMKGLLRNPAVAETIANNNKQTFRLRYLTSAATACYWREMIHAYKSVSFKPKVWADNSATAMTTGVNRTRRRGISWESFVLLGDDNQVAFNEADWR